MSNDNTPATAPVINQAAPAAQAPATLSGWKAALVKVGILTGTAAVAGAAGYYAGSRVKARKDQPTV